MANGMEKITLVPLHSVESGLLQEHETLDLGFGVSVESCKSLLGIADLGIWNHKQIQDDRDEIAAWNVCLVHRYQSS